MHLRSGISNFYEFSFFQLSLYLNDEYKHWRIAKIISARVYYHTMAYLFFVQSYIISQINIYLPRLSSLLLALKCPSVVGCQPLPFIRSWTVLWYYGIDVNWSTWFLETIIFLWSLGVYMFVYGICLTKPN